VARYDAPSATHDDDLTVETLLDSASGGVVGADASVMPESFGEQVGAGPVAAVGSGGDRILSVAQVARRLGCSVSLVQKWRRLGWIPAIQLGPPDVPIYGYRAADVDAYAERAWNRRRGRPPKDPNAVPVSRRRPPTAPTPVDEYAMGDPSDDALEEVTRATQPVQPAGPVVSPAQRPVIVPAARGIARALPESRPTSITPSAAAEVTRTNRPARGRPPKPVMTGPLTIWAGDPRDRGALMLVRLPPGPIEQAVAMAERYAGRYDDIVLSEAQGPGAQAAAAPVLGRWERGARTEG
jgi:hypothetical protein